jgi:hypothetical protein|tara:strand:- start:688 stop:1266 length:579 start_codon:yes stop_codon:yes gene_type:complete
MTKKYDLLRYFMKKIFAIIFLSICFIIPSKADDIQDFQIEGISVGSSLLDFYSKEKILKNKNKDQYKLDKFYLVSINDTSFKEYESMKFHMKKDDGKYIIHSLSGQIMLDINECLIKQKAVLEQLKTFFNNPKIDDLGKRQHPAYPGGYTYDIYITLKSGLFSISCYDLHVDAFLISADTDEFNDFLNKTYK